MHGSYGTTRPLRNAAFQHSLRNFRRRFGGRIRVPRRRRTFRSRISAGFRAMRREKRRRFEERGRVVVEEEEEESEEDRSGTWEYKRGAPASRAGGSQVREDRRARGFRCEKSRRRRRRG